MATPPPLWARDLPPGIVKSALVDASHAPAAMRFRVVDGELLPALHRNDIGTARELLAHTLQPLFADHRDRVEFTVAAARRENAEREAGARAAHTLISTAAMLGASALAEVARELHDAIDVGAPERWPALLARIDAVQSDVDVRVTEYLRAAPSHDQATG